jgi:hypothetical protein
VGLIRLLRRWEVKSGVDSSPSSVGEQCTGSDWVGTLTVHLLVETY